MAKQVNPELTEEQKRILLEGGTEAPFSGTLLNNTESGMYTCANCGNELFSSETKYESTIPGLMGWPSFSKAAQEGAVKLQDDNSLGMQRTEVICANCGGHLGHVFPDDSSDTGDHYCINSAGLCFAKKGQ